jgi:hypothetical protein
MTYERLVDFVKNRMRMSHVYQPVILMTLLQAGGRSSIEEIAPYSPTTRARSSTTRASPRTW